MNCKRVPKPDYDIQFTVSKEEAELLLQMFNKAPVDIAKHLGSCFDVRDISRITKHAGDDCWYHQLNRAMTNPTV